MNMQKYKGSMQMNNMMNGFQAGATKPMSNGMLQQQAEDDKERSMMQRSVCGDALKIRFKLTDTSFSTINLLF